MHKIIGLRRTINFFLTAIHLYASICFLCLCNYSKKIIHWVELNWINRWLVLGWISWYECMDHHNPSIHHNLSLSCMHGIDRLDYHQEPCSTTYYRIHILPSNIRYNSLANYCSHASSDSEPLRPFQNPCLAFHLQNSMKCSKMLPPQKLKHTSFWFWIFTQWWHEAIWTTNVAIRTEWMSI